MKTGRRLFIIGSLLGMQTLQAQTDVQNTGTLYISGSADILYVSGALTNASGAALTNNGSLYVLKDLSNSQSSMAAGTGTLYLNGSTVQNITGSQLFKTYHLVTNNGSGFMLNNDLSVSGLHTFTAGVITSSSTPNYLQYEAGSSYTGDADTRHVKGWIRKTGNTAFIFPLGNGTAERTIGISSLASSSVFNANYAGTTNNTSSLQGPLVSIDPNEYWIVNQASGGTAVVNMNWDNNKIAMPRYALADIRVASYQSSLWTQQGGTATGSPSVTGSISSGTLPAFGQFTFGSVSYVLPVTLVQFSGYNNNGNATINWTTNNEMNVARYEVQRSDDGISFYSIGNTTAHNLTGLQQYELTDNKSLNGAAYYRLLMVDADGKTKFSQIITVSNSNSTEKYFTIANPAHSSIQVRSKNITGEFVYRIDGINGQAMQQGTLKVSGNGTIDIHLTAQFKNGWYVLQIEKAGFSFSEKVLVD